MPLYQDLFVRDTFGDNGNTPVTDASVSASPDIIPYGVQQLNTATAKYGPPLLDQPLDNNSLNNIYVRVTNNAAGASSGQVYLYFSTSNLLWNVTNWSQNVIANFNGLGYAQVSATSNGQVVFGDQPFHWNPQSQAGAHFCFVARVVTPANPNPLPPPFTVWTQFVTWVRNNANVAWHNVDIVDSLPAQGYQVPALFQNVNLTPQFYAFTATYSGMPPGSIITLFAVPGPGFSGFTSTITTTAAAPAGVLPGIATFPGLYQTTIFATCVFPGGPLLPPSGALLHVESLGPQDDISAPENREFRSFSHAPERLGVAREEAGLGPDGVLVPIASYSSLFSPTPASRSQLHGPRRIFFKDAAAKRY